MSAPASRDIPLEREQCSRWRGQFARPSGLLGVLAGYLMARTNASMNQTAAELLDVQPDDRIVEIGFGPGELVSLLAERASRGYVAGVDPSEVMVRQAMRRNRAAVAQGRVALRRGTVSHLPYPDGSFTKACAVNSFQLWPSPLDDLHEVRRVLSDGGLLLLGLRVRDPSRRFMGSLGFSEDEVQRVGDVVREAGYRNVRVEVRHLPGERAAYVLARR